MWKALAFIPLLATSALAVTTVTSTHSFNTCQSYQIYTSPTAVPGVTSTLSLPLTTTETKTAYSYPFPIERRSASEESTVTQWKLCATTAPVEPLTVYTPSPDPAMTTTKTEYAATATYTSTYTLCLPENASRDASMCPKTLT